MRYFRLFYYTKKNGKDYEVRETLIDEITLNQIRKAQFQGKDYIDLGKKGVGFKTSSIKEWLPADDDIDYYKSIGYSLKELGLPERKQIESNTNVSEFAKELTGKMSMGSHKDRTKAQEEGAKEDRK